MKMCRYSIFSLALLLCIPTNSQTFVSLEETDLKKLTAWLAATLPVAYYFFHRPDARNSSAPFERVLDGRWDNVIDDTFNMENIYNITDLIPGQRWKVYAYKFNGESGATMKIPYPNKSDIKGFGLIHFTEKNMSKICKLLTASLAAYVILDGKVKATAVELLKLFFNPVNRGLNALSAEETSA